MKVLSILIYFFSLTIWAKESIKNRVNTLKPKEIKVDTKEKGFNYKVIFKVNLDGEGNFLKSVNDIKFRDVLSKKGKTRVLEAKMKNFFVRQRISESGLFLDVYLKRKKGGRRYIEFTFPIRDGFNALSYISYKGNVNGCYSGYIEFKDECVPCNTKLSQDGVCLRKVEDLKIFYEHTSFVCNEDIGNYKVNLKCNYEYRCEGLRKIQKGTFQYGSITCANQNNTWEKVYTSKKNRDVRVTCDKKNFKKVSCDFK